MSFGYIFPYWTILSILVVGCVCFFVDLWWNDLGVFSMLWKKFSEGLSCLVYYVRGLMEVWSKLMSNQKINREVDAIFAVGFLYVVGVIQVLFLLLAFPGFEWSKLSLESLTLELQVLSLLLLGLFFLWLFTWEGLEGPWKSFPLVFLLVKSVLWGLSAPLFLSLCLCSLTSWVLGMGGLFVFLMYQDTDLSPSWNTFFLISLVVINLGVLGVFLL